MLGKNFASQTVLQSQPKSKKAEKKKKKKALKKNEQQNNLHNTQEDTSVIPSNPPAPLPQAPQAIQGGSVISVSPAPQLAPALILNTSGEEEDSSNDTVGFTKGLLQEVIN